MDFNERLSQIHSETATIKWRELQRFFAQGLVLNVTTELDLVHTAALMAQDDSAAIEPLLTSAQLAAPSNQQAKAWYEDDAELWSVVVAPFVLVQDKC